MLQNVSSKHIKDCGNWGGGGVSSTYANLDVDFELDAHTEVTQLGPRSDEKDVRTAQ